MKTGCVAVVLMMLVACEPKIPTRPPIPQIVPAEPQHVFVQHILVAFAGAERATVTRTQEEAETLAKDLLGRIKAGEEIGPLMKKHSDDPGGGRYRMANRNVSTGKGEQAYEGMVPGFSEMAFSLKVRETGLVPYDKVKSPFGYHIIQRLE